MASTSRREFVKGLITTNPVFVLLLGLCPTLAVSTSIDNALGMTLAFLIVLLGANVIISAIRGFVPSITRIPIFIVIVATLVTTVNLLFNAFLPDLHETLGIYLPLVVVNCIVLGRAEAFASKNPMVSSIADALGMTAGFMIALVTISFVRQLLGTGEMSVFGFHIFSLPVLTEHPLAIFILPPGGFLVLGLLLALLRWKGVLKL